MSDTPRVDDEITKVQKIHAEKELDDVEHYMETFKRKGTGK